MQLLSEQVTFISGDSIMNEIKDGDSTTRPLILDEMNYSYWKSRMTTFMKSIESNSRKAIVTGWSHPTMKDDDGKDVLKPEV